MFPWPVLVTADGHRPVVNAWDPDRRKPIGERAVLAEIERVRSDIERMRHT